MRAYEEWSESIWNSQLSNGRHSLQRDWVPFAPALSEVDREICSERVF